MKVKCPKCGCSEDVESCQIGDKVQCPCGHEYAAGVFPIDVNLFSDGQADIACPYCGTPLAIPEEAIDRNVRCSECNEKFKIVKLQQTKNPQFPTKNELQEQKHSASPQAKTANKKDTAVQIENTDENIVRGDKPLARKQTTPILNDVGKAVKFFASIVAIVLASICIGFIVFMICIGLDINSTDQGLPLDSSLPRLPMYIDDFQNGKTYYYPQHDFCPLKVAGVVKPKCGS